MAVDMMEIIFALLWCGSLVILLMAFLAMIIAIVWRILSER
jgi:hypothetical protein